MKDILTLAFPKGRLLNLSVSLFRKIGIRQAGLTAGSRKLLFENKNNPFRFMIVRAVDVPTYVEHGAADIGIAGKDLIMEQSPDVYEPLDLGFGACRLIVALPKKKSSSTDGLRSKLRIATKYPRITERFFSAKGIPVEIIKLSGAIELAPLVGLSDRIVDLITTGKTLRENHLVEEEVVMESTAQLIVNRASLKTKSKSITTLMNRLRKVVEGNSV